MSPNDLLEEEDRYRWYILQILELKRQHFLSITELMATLGLSKYKLTKYLEELQMDTRQFNHSIEISVEPSGEIVTVGLNSQILKRLRLYYLERSMMYQIFLELLVGGNQTVDTIANKLFLSRSKAYTEYKALKVLLEKAGFYLKNLKIQGDELALRSFVYWLFFEFYSGIKSPFSAELTAKVSQLKTFFLLEHQLFLTNTEEIKLEFYLGVSLLRMESKSAIVTAPFKRIKQYQVFPVSYFRESQLTDQQQEAETNTFLFFCYVEKIISDHILTFNSSKVEEEINLITSDFMAILITYLEDGHLVNHQVIEDELKRINRKWLYFHLRDTTFISANQRSYFQEVYPMFNQIISRFIDDLVPRGLFFSKEELTKVYYDYLFLLIDTVDVHLIEMPIYICIDFSHGDYYNRYIENSLKQFGHSSIVFERKISSSTQIYISDFVMTKLLCEQVVWKNPPSAGDWKDFGDLLIRLKRLDNE